MPFTNKIKAAGLYAGAAAFAMMIAAGADQAAAQTGQMPPAAQQQQPQSEPLTDAHVQSYVQAENAAVAVQAKYRKQAEGISSQEELAALQQSMGKDIAKAVESSGLSIDEFNAIGKAVRSNPQANQRYLQLQQQ